MAQIETYFDESSSTYLNKRDYLQGHLYDTLKAGKSYCVTYYINLDESSGYIVNHTDAYLNDGQLDTLGYYCGLPLPQIHPQIVNLNLVSDTMNWTKIQGSFIANGMERFITIGNFGDTAHTAHVQTTWFEGLGSTFSAYLVDDVSVIESDLPAYAGRDTSIVQGDSVFIGRVPEIGLECKWYRGSTPLTMTLFDSTAGFWVRPDTTTYYVVEQTLCGNVLYDTVKITVGLLNVPIGSEKLSNILVYPNPAKDVVNIANAVGTTVTIYDVVGRKVKEIAINENRTQVSISDLASGVYFVEIRASDGSRKVVRLLHEQGE